MWLEVEVGRRDVEDCVFNVFVLLYGAWHPSHLNLYHYSGTNGCQMLSNVEIQPKWVFQQNSTKQWRVIQPLDLLENKKYCGGTKIIIIDVMPLITYHSFANRN